MQKVLTSVETKKSDFDFVSAISMFLMLLVGTNRDIGLLSSALYWGIVFFYLFVSAIKIYKKRDEIKLNTYVIWYFSFFVFCLISVLYSIDLLASMDIIKALAVNVCILFCLSSTINSKANLNFVIKILVLVIIFNTIYLYFNVDWSLLGQERIAHEEIGQGWNANSIGLMMLWATMLCCYLAKETKNKIWYLTIVLYLPLIIYSGSRKVWIGLVLFILVMIYVNNKRRLLLSLLIGGLALIVIYNLIMNVEFLYNAGGNRLEAFFNGFTGQGDYDSSAEKRAFYVEQGWKWFLEKPIFGHGIATFGRKLHQLTRENVYSHNNFIELLFGVGITGSIIFYAMYFKTIKTGIVNLFIEKKDQSEQSLILFFMLVINVIMHYAMVMYTSILDLMILLLAFSYYKIQVKQKSF